MPELKQHQFHRGDALKVAKELCDYLAPHCDRIIVAGSLRRRRLVVGDVEILYIPKTVTEKDGLFDQVDVNLAEKAIQSLLEASILEKRPNTLGHSCWGPQNKLAIHKASGIPVDLFATDEPRWWVAKVIRTGPKETNLALTNGAIALGRKLHAYGVGVEDMTTGQIFPAGSEQEVFTLCGVPYAEPWNRR